MPPTVFSVPNRNKNWEVEEEEEEGEGEGGEEGEEKFHLLTHATAMGVGKNTQKKQALHRS